jgi:hypothetical protein
LVGLVGSAPLWRRIQVFFKFIWQRCEFKTPPVVPLYLRTVLTKSFDASVVAAKAFCVGAANRFVLRLMLPNRFVLALPIVRRCGWCCQNRFVLALPNSFVLPKNVSLVGRGAGVTVLRLRPTYLGLSGSRAHHA